MAYIENAGFKTIDGHTLRGLIYPASGRGPGVILAPGFNGVKERMKLPDGAEEFQRAGITALIYDPRTTSLSDGMSRNDIDPMKQVEDYSDALTFLADHPVVDRNRIAFWGVFFAGTVSLCAADFDKGAKLVIAVGLMTRVGYTPELLPKVLTNYMKDRESQLKGTPVSSPNGKRSG